MQWALDAKKLVSRLSVDPAAVWTGGREQDALLAATTEKQTLDVWRAVRGLRAFRAFLENQTTRALFATPDQTPGLLVATGLFPWLPGRMPAACALDTDNCNQQSGSARQRPWPRGHSSPPPA